MHLVRMISDVRQSLVEDLYSECDDNTAKSTSQLKTDSEKFGIHKRGKDMRCLETPIRNGRLSWEQNPYHH